MTSSYYADTAYNSQHIPLQPEPQREKPRGILQKMAAVGLTRLPYSETNNSIPDTLYRDYTPSSFNAEQQEVGGSFYWNEKTLATATFKWPGQVLSILLGLAWVFAFPGIIFALISALISFFLEDMSWEGGIKFLIFYFIWVFPPAFLIWSLGYFLNHSDYVPQWLHFLYGAHKDYELNRQTGMVTLYDSRNKVRFSHPFIEFDAILIAKPNHQGLLFHSLALVHRYNGYAHGVAVGDLIGGTLQRDNEQLWNVLQQYMDVSKPLPDFLQLEESRPKDPTTAAHDKQSGRHPRYWRDMSDEEYKKVTDELIRNQSHWSGMPINIFQPTS